MKETILKEGWSEKDRKHMLHGGVPLDAFAEKGSEMIMTEGRGIILEDSQGREYIDGISGAVCVNLGYGRTPQLLNMPANWLNLLPMGSSASSLLTVDPRLMRAPIKSLVFTG
jgi:acetylornithine/succinyldiaminopimelate/putrescine aminotransferase